MATGRRIGSQWILAVVLTLGVLTVPVRCSQAAGPHSLFAAPNAATAAAAHQSHGREGQHHAAAAGVAANAAMALPMPVAATGPDRTARSPAAVPTQPPAPALPCREPASDRLTVSEVPVPAEAMSVFVAAPAPVEAIVVPTSGIAAAAPTVALVGRSSAPDPPPPRGPAPLQAI